MKFPLGLVLLCAGTLFAQDANVSALNSLEWRSIGPGAMGGRIAAVEGVPGNPRIVYAATGSGGLFKSDNAGTTWQPIFERPGRISIGDIAIDPKNPTHLWVGTGEANLRNSVSIGGGVFYSADGGAHWQPRGLESTMTISRLLLDPRDPHKIFVAAVGHPFGPNPERGVYVSSDDGQSWRKTLYVDTSHGASDIDIDPTNSNVVFAGMWMFDRKPWRYDSGDTKGGLFRSGDGGKTWKKITQGLPALMGRVGVKIAPSNPKVVYVIAETREGTLFRSNDGGETFQTISSDKSLVSRGYYFCDLRVDPKDENRVYVLEGALMVSNDGGKTFSRIGGSVHSDLQTLWIDPLDPQRMWQGNDGGLASSWDGGETWQHVASISLGQFYRVSADNREPFYQVSGGTQDNGTWTGPSRTREPSGILNDDWRMVSTIVGFNVLADSEDPDVLLTQQPGGALLRTNMLTRDQQSVGPQVRNYGGALASEMKYRFGWDAPLVRSPFGKSTFYYGANVVFQSSDLGKDWEPISSDLTAGDPSKWQPSGGPVFTDNSSSEIYGVLTQIAESPAQRGLIWTGSDDGNVQVTENGGGHWTNVAVNIAGVPPHSPVSAVEPSHHNPKVTYVAFNRHMFDDMQPYVFKTADSGKTWTRITQGLPPYAFVWVVREDLKNPSILYAGTETGLFASFDDGGHWVPFGLKNLPDVAVRDIFQQAQNNDLILATHGRGLYILDDATPVQQIASAAGKAAVLFPVRPAFRHAVRATRSGGGDTEWAAPNPPYGALLDYYLGKPAGELRIQIVDDTGKTVRTIGGNQAPSGVGLHRIAWDLRASAVSGAPARGGRGGEGGRGGGGRGPQVLPGTYTVRLTADGATAEQKVQVRLDPDIKAAPADLQAQWDTLSKLGGMIREVGQMVRQADEHPDSAEWKAFRATLARPRNLGNSETGPRLSEQLQSLFNLVDGPNDAPTPAMMKLTDELENEYRKATGQLHALQP
ncbi:MAG TPA: hypothetical protein VHW09_09885 [Bryobacteraceae bacterium]|jgi:photosystem II stability/assembly factor-like uncharacterized protein|nr:hypothetical protein [Bryobacteraceae bacterium]